MPNILRGRISDVERRALPFSLEFDRSKMFAGVQSDDMLFLREDGSISLLSQSAFEKSLDVTSLKGYDTLAVTGSYGLNEAYQNGGISDGRKIDLSALTGDPVWLYSNNLSGDFALYVNWDANGDLVSNSSGNVIFDTKRTLRLGSDGVSDNFVNFEVTRWSIANLAGQTFSSAGAVGFFRVRNTQSAGTLADTTRVIELNAPTGSTHTGPFIYAGLGSETYPRFQLGRDGTISLGSGGSATYATIGRDAGGGVVINEAGSNFDPVFRVEQPGQPNAIFLDNTVGLGLYTNSPQAGLHLHRRSALFDLTASGQTFDIQNEGVELFGVTTGATGGTIDIGAGGNSTSLRFGAGAFFDADVNTLTTTRGFHPGINNYYDLGGTSYKWRNALFNGYVDAFAGFFSNGSPAAIVQVQDGSGNDTFVVDTLTNVAEINNGMSLGIGTDTPDRLLEVIDASNPQVRLTATDATYYTDLQSHTTATWGGLAILPAANASGFKAVTLFSTTESSGLALFYDGSDYWIRTTHSGKGINFNTANTFDFNINFGIKLRIGAAAIDLYVPGSYRTSGSDTNSVTEVLALYKATSATPAAGYGLATNMYLEDGSGNYPIAAGVISIDWTDPTAGSYDARLKLRVAINGSVTDVLHLRDSGIEAYNNVYPATNDQSTLGAESLRWAQVYTIGLSVQGGMRTAYDEDSTASHIITSDDGTVIVDSSGGAKTQILPATDAGEVGSGFTVNIKREGANTVTITPNGSNTIEGATSLVLGVSGDCVTLMSNGGSGAAGDWKII